MYRKIAFFILTLSCSAWAQAPELFYGKIVGLQPETKYTHQTVFPAAAASGVKYRFSPTLEKGSSLSVGKLIDPRTRSEVEAILVEPPDKMPYLCADLNANGAIEKEERFEFANVKDNLFSVTLKLPIKNELFNVFPVYIRYPRGFTHPKLAATDRLLIQTDWAFAVGDVKINGRDVRFRYPFEPDQQPAISTTEGLFGIDIDGDGRFHNEQFSLETSYAKDDETVLRYGDIYLSTSKIDLTKNEIVVRRRDPKEYLREELSVGKEMPDFSFTDFDNKTRRLSEFRGKYVLVDFWGVWCVDCVRDFPFLVQAYERFHSRGLEILGLNWDDKVEDAAAFLIKSKAPWPQARKTSIKTLTEVTYRVQEYPSAILLGPDGKVLVLDQDQLEGEDLLQTLDRALPR